MVYRKHGDKLNFVRDKEKEFDTIHDSSGRVAVDVEGHVDDHQILGYFRLHVSNHNKNLAFSTSDRLWKRQKTVLFTA